jgi:hypothetical protein
MRLLDKQKQHSPEENLEYFIGKANKTSLTYHVA